MRLLGGPAGPDELLAHQLWNQLDTEISTARS